MFCAPEDSNRFLKQHLRDKISQKRAKNQKQQRPAEAFAAEQRRLHRRDHIGNDDGAANGKAVEKHRTQRLYRNHIAGAFHFTAAEYEKREDCKYNAGACQRGNVTPAGKNIPGKICAAVCKLRRKDGKPVGHNVGNGAETIENRAKVMIDIAPAVDKLRQQGLHRVIDDRAGKVKITYTAGMAAA